MQKYWHRLLAMKIEKHRYLPQKALSVEF